MNSIYEDHCCVRLYLSTASLMWLFLFSVGYYYYICQNVHLYVFNCFNRQTTDSTSPRAPRRVNKKPAPLPPTEKPTPPSVSYNTPGSTGSLDRKHLTANNSTGSLDRKTPPDRPPELSQDKKTNTHQLDRPPSDRLVTNSDKPSDRPPVPDRPPGPPPPAPGKDSQGTCKSDVKPERPRLPSDRPQVPPPDKPKTPAYDVGKTSPNVLPYSSKPETTATTKPENTLPPVSPNTLKGNKPPRPANRPPPLKSGSKGSEKDFAFVKELQQNISPSNSQEKNSGETRTPDDCETHL